MDFNDHHQDLTSAPSEAPFVADKEQIIQALESVIAHYPQDEVPFDVMEQALSKFLAPRNLGRLNNNPAIEKLDKVIAQYKTPRK
jgi:hypothetical protein